MFWAHMLKKKYWTFPFEILKPFFFFLLLFDIHSNKSKSNRINVIL